MIDTIIFDLSEVYLNGILGIENRLVPILGIKNPKEIHLRLEGDKFWDYMHGKISENEYWTKTLEENKWPLTLDTLKELARKNFQEIPGTRGIIESLKNQGYKLGLLSVHGQEWIDYCEEKFDYHKLFDEISYSFQEGVSKPNKKAYEIILRKLKADPKKTIFTDDSRKNIEAARNLGINAIRFENPKQLIEELKKFGVCI